MPTTTLRELDVNDALAYVDGGAALVDLRPVDDFLDVHIRGSLPLVYEFGPGMANRARDCLPLDVPLILLGTYDADMDNAAASLRGKGFAVIGSLRDGLERWSRDQSRPVSTEILDRLPDNTIILDVGDPGAGRVESATRIPAENLWVRVDELDRSSPVVVLAGFGVRAALAAGILEHKGVRDVALYRAADR